jgi:hypothetical protein
MDARYQRWLRKGQVQIAVEERFVRSFVSCDMWRGARVSGG